MCAIVPIVRQALIDSGIPQIEVKNKEIVHMYLRERFCPPIETWSDTEQKYITAPASVQDLNNQQFFLFKEDIQRWSVLFLGVYLPDPNEEVKTWEAIPEHYLTNHDNSTIK